MLAFPAGFRIFVATAPVDMRKQFNGLWTEAQERLKEDPRQGAVFAFIVSVQLAGGGISWLR